MRANQLIAANLSGLGFTLTINYLATALPINGRNPGEVSDLYPNLFTPAGFTFAIWGVIYALLIGFAVYQTRFWSKPQPMFLQKIGWWFALSCLVNGGWLMAFHYLKIGISLLVMLILLGCLLLIYRRLQAAKSDSSAEKWLVRLPFSVYLGWISVATIANATIFLSTFGWQGEPLGAAFWTVLVIAAALSVALLALWKKGDIALAAVIAWAFWGIFSKRKMDVVAADEWVEMAALGGLVLLGIGIIWRTTLALRQ